MVWIYAVFGLLAACVGFALASLTGELILSLYLIVVLFICTGIIVKTVRDSEKRLLEKMDARLDVQEDK